MEATKMARVGDARANGVRTLVWSRFVLEQRHSSRLRMLAGCSSAAALSDASVQLKAYHFQLQEKHCPSQPMMGAQRFDLTRGFSKGGAPYRALSSEKPAETRGSYSIISPSSPSTVVETALWRGRSEEILEDPSWVAERSSDGSSHKRKSSSEDSCLERAKRTRAGGLTATHLAGGHNEYYFIPNSAISTAQLALVRSLGTERDWGGVAGGTNGESHTYSSSSSENHSSPSEPNGDSSENEMWVEPPIPFPSGDAEVRDWREDTQTENQGFELLSLLTSCAEAISSGDNAATKYFIARLGELASPFGTPIHRLAVYFTEALALRAVKLWPLFFSISPPRELADQVYEDDAIALRVLNHVSPIPKFLHFTLNERLLRTFEGKDRVHIIDFDIKQGLQWPGLLQSLASSPNPPSQVRITGIGESKQDLQETGARLSGLAEALNIHLEFHPVVDRLEDVRLWMLHVKEKECVAVNCVLQLHKVLYNETGRALMDLLDLVRSTNPDIVLVAEQEAEHNDARWERRFASSLQYYSAIFDSLDSCLPEDSAARIKIEEMFAREIRSIVACEGGDRVEQHEKFAKWRMLMENAGFRCTGIGERERAQSRLLLRMYPSENYSIDQQGENSDGLTLRWLDQPLYTVSAWTPVDIAGSSAASQPG